MTKFAHMLRAVVIAALIAAVALGLSGGIAAAQVYGDPVGAADYWVQQNLDDCSLMATADVVGQLTGHQPTEQEIVHLATITPSAHHDGPVYLPPPDPDDLDSGRGTDSRDLPLLLAHYGIQSVYTDDDVADDVGVPTGLASLAGALAAGHKVIAGVNAETIWDIDGDRSVGNHDLVVTAIDTDAGVVHLNDSGTEDGADEQVSIATFERAWQTSDHDMVVALAA
ncbi:hypothetical protein [Mycolicibacterium pulveris]|uniref:hypothetical protein n=1 Tax=Mycolicibacterium pulveris TaxID=36813 RepID=UPI003CF3F943